MSGKRLIFSYLGIKFGFSRPPKRAGGTAASGSNGESISTLKQQ